MSNDFAIQMEHIWTRFGDKVIHKDINLNLPRGEILGLVGASGCGKTTLLREIIGLQIPSEGEVFVMGQSLKKITVGHGQRLRSDCGVLFQKGALFSVLDVFDNIAFPLREVGVKDEELISRLVFMKLAMVGLSPDDAWLKPADLSGGMIKRVALARTMILEPGLLLLDEPTSGLDPISSEDFVTLLSELHRDLKFTVVMVTHDLDILRDLCTQVAVLADNQLVAFGPLASVLNCPHPFVKSFFHNRRARRVFQYQEEAHG
ncbi:MAG: ATP-binding cassette domain-containing protein [Methylococcaceae bacterium]|jgi:phospholipid/cholesterol/gamma-HCH transport system ATP-binding protein|nr:ATP-binding cassette domain-containing protein [Methylococcaceae bacterium]MDP2394567.1 ATP-binding cassette domain-containing protein [Methylococcaceae bacterium]MDP3019948.1 ATP-binding cassette domain-containing protein [Methylococcaceae bacterium]MDP3390585.1 ATP-binding cassette domain-containing protein [Methylococcaceae bacterium]MDP3933888.1 ATP-binding cassette domain-containing protein [Methylococcaceae bacterium]